MKNMSSSRAEMLPADDVLKSGALTFPGVFDQTGCPLLVFPAETQHKLKSDEINKEDVSQFIHYCLRLHRSRKSLKKVEETQVSVVADLRQADISIVRFITETLLWLEVYRRIIHSVYIVQPKKRSVQKQLVKLLTPSSKQNKPILFKRVFLKDVFELSNYIDRSQLTSDLGGYLIYSHESWVNFIKEIDAFVQEFLSVVSRLPSCISTLQSLAKLPVPADFEALSEFCSVNEARFQQLRRDLGLDELLKRCECLLEKLRYPETEPCFHAMAGTNLFANTTLEMIHNYNRINAAVEKVELLWQQVFSKARLQLQVIHLQREAQQIQEQMIVLHREKVQSYRIEPAEDVHRAESLRLEFETSVYMHAMALVRRADDVIHTLAEMFPLTELQPREPWIDDLRRIKENLASSVQHLYQTLRNLSDFHYTLNKCKNWHNLVLCKAFLQDLLVSRSHDGLDESSFSPDLSGVRRGFESFLRRNPCPSVQELVKLAHLANVISDPNLQYSGKQLSHRCMTLRRLLTSRHSVDLHDLQLALHWQYEHLMSNNKTSDITTDQNKPLIDSLFISNSVSHRRSVSHCESLFDSAKCPSSVGSPVVASAAVKPLSLSSFDSGFDGAGSSHLDIRSRRDCTPGFLGSVDSIKPKPAYAEFHEENVTSVSDSEDHEELRFSLKKDNAQASIQIVPKITSDSLNLEIKVKRSATLPKNPWLSLPIDDLESSYTVTITQNASREPSARTHDLDTDMKSQDGFEDSDLGPISNVLSSTITDHEEKPSGTAEGEASLVWDTFDLHNLRQDSSERLGVSLCDWVQREQQELQEVEKTLNRAAVILQEEEHVLEQEVILDNLLKTDDLYKHWPLWNEDQHNADQSQSAVIGLDDDDDDDEDDDISSALPISPQSKLSSSDSDTFKTSEICQNPSPELFMGSPAHLDGLIDQKVDRSHILQELKDLDEQIIEESLKLDALRCSESEEHRSDVTTHSSCGDLKMILAHPEEKKVENIDKSLNGGQIKVKKGSGHKVVKCSIMDRNLNHELRNCGFRHHKLQDLHSAHLKHLSDPATDETSSQQPHHTDTCQSTSEEDYISQTHLNETIMEDFSLKVLFDTETLSLDVTHASEHCSSLDVINDQCHSESVTQIPSTHLSACVQSESFSDLTVVNICQSETDDVSDPEQDTFDPGGVVTSVPAVWFDMQKSNQTADGHEQSDSISCDETIQIPREFTNPLYGQHMRNNNNNKNTVAQPPVLDGDQSEAQMSCESSRVPSEMKHTDCMFMNVKGVEMIRQISDKNEGDVYDGGGDSVRAVYGSSLDRLQMNTSTRPMEYKTPIVLDTGSGLMKAGFADQDLPSSVFPTIIGHPKYEEVMSGGVNRELYVGHDAQHMRGVLTLKHPIKNGIVNNWDEMEMIWHHAFQQLAVDPQDHPVLLTEAARNPVENRQRMIEVMFEVFNVPLTFVAMQAVLALYASGRTTGVVLDSGDGVSHCVPVFDGYCLPHAVQRFNLAGADVTSQLQKLLLDQGVRMQTSAELEIVREMKEKCCYVALDYESELRRGDTDSSELHYTLPDGRLISLTTEPFRAPEILFRPELIGRDHYGMHESVFKSILQSDIDLRRSFVGNILLSGGNTLLAGLPERLQYEIRHMVPVDLMENVRVLSPKDRDFSVWCGGAVLSNLPMFSSAWISADEYEEFGPQIVFRKCF
ncbi:uncharacterized protein [Misgurnus anguillicaudatus]|uniref:uncharacterized protein isoform X2 n=1 Tax=Misgurnus anguillicaudatus TaxID=75329 RepID=UPI003CCF707D